MMRKLLSLLMTSSLLLVGLQATAMDESTRDMVIQRIERVLVQMDPQEKAWVATNLRLADLLAERARDRFMSEVEKNCESCQGSKADRDRALGLYTEVLKRPTGFNEGVILIQMAHLHDQAGESQKSQKIFERILTEKKYAKNLDLRDQARVALADLHFHQGRHQEALKLYLEAQKVGTSSHKGLIQYRLSWSLFHLGRLDEATKQLEKLSGDKQLLQRQNTKGASYDEGFHNDIVRDLAIFYARQPIRRSQIESFKRLTPAASRSANLLFFGEEAERVGQKAAAGLIYQNYLLEKDLTSEQRVDAFIRLAQVKADLGRETESTEEFAVAAKSFRDLKCGAESKCESLQKRMRTYVTERHRAQKAEVNLDVAKAYFIYSRTFPSDLEMSLRGAQVAMDLKQYPMAAQLYREASLEGRRQLQTKNEARTKELLRGAVFGEVEAAELARDLNLRNQAYRHAIETLPTDPETFMIRYQLAHLSYERKNWSQAAQEFRILALDQKGSLELRKKSADLALDSLAIEKRDADIEALSLEFAEAFPASATEYKRLSRKALTSQVVQTANNEKASASELKKTLKKLLSADLSGANDSERRLHLKNTVVLARRAGEKETLEKALLVLLASRGLSNQEKEDLQAQLVGEYESRKDYDKAYQLALQMSFPRLSKAEKELRLGLLAELAGRDTLRHDRAALAAGLQGPRAQQLRLRLIEKSAQPVAEFKKYQKELRRDPRLYAETLLFLYAKTRNLKQIQGFYLSGSAFRKLAPIRYMEKQPFYASHQNLMREIGSHQLKTQTDRQIQVSLEQRLRLLQKADAAVKSAARLGDFTAQVLTLTTVAVENERLVTELQALPAPKGLQPEELKQYQQLLRQQAQPYANKASRVRGKLAEVWNDESSLNALIRDYESARPEIRPLIQDELRLLAMAAPARPKGRLERTLSAKPSSGGPSARFERETIPGTKSVSFLVGPGSKWTSKRIEKQEA